MSGGACMVVKQSEMEFRALSEHGAIGVTKTGRATASYVFSNHRFADIVGYTRDELLAMSSYAPPPDDLAEELDNLGRLLKDGQTWPGNRQRGIP